MPRPVGTPTSPVGHKTVFAGVNKTLYARDCLVPPVPTSNTTAKIYELDVRNF